MVWTTLRTLFRQSKKNRLRPHRAQLAMERLEDRMAPALLGNQLYPSDHPWNQRITDAPVASNSSAIINDIVADFGNGRLHPDFGQLYGDSRGLYGIPYNIVHGNSVAKVQVVIDAYPDESDILPVPLPANVVLENDYQNGPRFGVNNRSDSHLLVYDVDNNIAYELFRASRPNENADGKWHADAEVVWDMNTNNFRTLGWTSADAAGLSLLAGLVRPDEGLPVSQGGQGVINHAIRFTLQNSIILDQYIYPASHTANAGNNNPSVQPPMGARFRLKAGVDISTLNPQSRIIAQAMKDYGMIVADNGGNFFFSGASASVDVSNNVTLTWDDDDIQDSIHGLKSLHYSDFEVVDLTPRVTDLSIHNGAAGTTVTVVGQNFSGAAGNLQVFFGNTAATGVTVIDDSHVQVTAPAGSGTVDVRVQSGVTTGPNPDNVKNTIFGYGVSAVTAADRFTYGDAPPSNQAPTIATAASANPKLVTGKSTLLSVVGADDAGESNLTYTWSIIAKPDGAADPIYSGNGDNAAKTTTAAFSKAGAYQFQVIVRDAEGLTASSAVGVSVVQTLSSIAITPSVIKLLVNRTVQFVAAASDQYGERLVAQPTFFWSRIGKGTIRQNGRYTAPSKPGGPYTILASAGGLSGFAKVTVVRSLSLARKMVVLRA